MSFATFLTPPVPGDTVYFVMSVCYPRRRIERDQAKCDQGPKIDKIEVEAMILDMDSGSSKVLFTHPITEKQVYMRVPNTELHVL